MILYINTSNNQKIELALYKNGRPWLKRESTGLFKQSEKLLPEIDKLLKKARRKAGEVRGIVVVKGPGSFSSLRIGAAVANTLAFSLGVPVKGILKGVDSAKFEKKIMKIMEKLGEGGVRSGFVVPEYGAEPNIT